MLNNLPMAAISVDDQGTKYYAVGQPDLKFTSGRSSLSPFLKVIGVFYLSITVQ